MSQRAFVMNTLALWLIAGLAWAQPPEGPPGGGFDRGGGRGRQGFGGPGMGGGFGFGGPGAGQVPLAMLIGIPEVQTELALGDPQKKDIGDLMADTLRQMRSSMSGVNFQELQDMSEEDRQKIFAEARKKAEEANQKAEAKLCKILDEKQLARLHQLRLQREGIAAINRPEVGKQLGLSDDQIAKIRKIQEQGRPRFGGPGGPGTGDQDPRDFMARMQKQREKVQADVLAALTDEQRTKWAEMKGKEFKFPQPQFGGFGRGGFGRGKAEDRVRPPLKKRDP